MPCLFCNKTQYCYSASKLYHWRFLFLPTLKNMRWGQMYCTFSVAKATLHRSAALRRCCCVTAYLMNVEKINSARNSSWQALKDIVEWQKRQIKCKMLKHFSFSSMSLCRLVTNFTSRQNLLSIKRPPFALFILKQRILLSLTFIFLYTLWIVYGLVFFFITVYF